MQQVPEPERIADMDRLVEAVVALHLLDRFRWDFNAPDGAAGPSFSCGHLEAQDLPFYRTARDKMHDDEHRERDAQKRGDDQQKTTNEITCHGLARWASISFWAAPNRSCQ